MTLRKLLFLLVSLCIFTACGGGDDASSGKQEDRNENANPASVVDANRWEIPRLKLTDDDIFIVHKTDDGLYNYCLEYHTRALHSRWVAYRYDSKLAQKNYPQRTDAWSPEPALSNRRDVQVGIGTFPGYQRGHLVGSAERYYSRQANEQTFYMSNMSPMIGAFNVSYWGVVEDKVRDLWGRPIASGDTLYVVKGGTIDGEQNILTRVGVKNVLGSETFMAVPKYYFIALLKRTASGNLTAIGFYMEHKDYKNTNKDFLAQLARDSACSIDELEQKTGIDFFCNMPDNIEEQVESSYSIGQWSGL